MLAALGPQVALLAVLQGLLLTNNVTLIAVNGLAGLLLAPSPLLATLPVTGYVLGGAVWSMPAAAFMRRHGRRAGYAVGSVAAIAGAVLAWHAMQQRDLWLLCAATFVSGLYNAFGASLKFAAVDASEAYRPAFKARAISLVLAGGIAGGIVGPELSKWSRDWLPQAFAGTYLTLAGFGLLSLLLAQAVRLPPATTAGAAPGTAPRPLRECLRPPGVIVAIVCASLSYGVMNLLMVATPLAMEVCGHPYASAAFVLQWHVIGMFAPGLVTGSVIARVGAPRVIVAGGGLMLVCVAIAVTGVDLMRFTVALFALGVGWNFMYTGATTLLAASWHPADRTRVQGFNDFCVFATMITSSASSGAMLHVNGWSWLNVLSIPFVVAMIAAVAWLASRQGWRAGAAPSAAR